jgi:hypothetical protein
MNSKVFVASIALLMLSISLPANGQSKTPVTDSQSKTPVTDEFGATGITPNADQWREKCRKKYIIRINPDGSLMTDTTEFTDQFGITGKTPNSNEWLKRISGRF